MARVFRDKPFSWQDKEAFRKMRDHFEGKKLTEVRNLYTGLTEIASDYENEDFKPTGGNKTLKTYTGMTEKAIRRARENLIKLGLIKVFDLYAKGGGNIGYFYILEKPDRDTPMLDTAEIPKITIDEQNLRIKGFDSNALVSNPLYEIKEILESKEVEKDNSPSQNFPPEGKKSQWSEVNRDLEELTDVWNQFSFLTPVEVNNFTRSALLELYQQTSLSKEDIKTAIRNYAKALSDQDCFWTWEYDFIDFLQAKKNNFYWVEKFAEGKITPQKGRKDYDKHV